VPAEKVDRTRGGSARTVKDTPGKERTAMMKHRTGTRKEWLTARLELLEAEKELTRRGDELARRRQELPWVLPLPRASAERPLGHVPVARPAPKGRNETGVWWRRHDEYDKR
jgi:predicted dithiol-disulfide oxidoreductase (DUF899 family)